MDGNPKPGLPAPVHFIRNGEAARNLDPNPALEPWQAAAPKQRGRQGPDRDPRRGPQHRLAKPQRRH